jgi:hypothetical protein
MQDRQSQLCLNFLRPPGLRRPHFSFFYVNDVKEQLRRDMGHGTLEAFGASTTPEHFRDDDLFDHSQTHQSVEEFFDFRAQPAFAGGAAVDVPLLATPAVHVNA